MEYRRFGTTDLTVSVVGFGAWGIGGPAMVGATPIGWGGTDDAVSRRALRRARELGITFYDTADFYGLGRSEELIGETFGNAPDIVVATKVGHRAAEGDRIVLDSSAAHIIAACERSLRRLRRDAIDYYQLHSARMPHLEEGECLEAMERLVRDGKVRYWGLSLNTFHPDAESSFLTGRSLGHGFQLALNIINQRALGVVRSAAASGYGVIARMPLQFGLLTGKFAPTARFAKDDHRSFRLTPEIVERSLAGIAAVRPVADRRGISLTTLALSFCAALPGISTVIPGIRTPEQAEENSVIVPLDTAEMAELTGAYEERFAPVVSLMEQQG